MAWLYHADYLYCSRAYSRGYYGWISYGLLYANEELLTGTEGQVPRYTDQRHTLSFVNDIDLGKRWAMNLLFNYGSGFAVTPYTSRYNEKQARYEWIAGKTNSEHMTAYKRVDVRISREFSLFSMPAYVFVEASNLLNAKNIYDYRYRYDSNGTPYRQEIELFPFIPSLGMSVKF